MGGPGGYDMGGPGGYEPPRPNGSGSRGNGGKRNNVLIVGVFAVVLLVLVGIGGIWLATKSDDKSPNTVGDNQTTTAPTSASPTPPKATGRPVPIDCKPKFQQADFLKRELERRGMTVTIAPKPTPGFLPNAVVEVQPCGEAVPAGSAITIYANIGKIDDQTTPPGDDSTGKQSQSANPQPGASKTCEPPMKLVGNLCVPG
jgi:serine/threonine-protein kinase